MSDPVAQSNWSAPHLAPLSFVCLLLESWDQLICQHEEIISVEKSFFFFAFQIVSCVRVCRTASSLIHYAAHPALNVSAPSIR